MLKVLPRLIIVLIVGAIILFPVSSAASNMSITIPIPTVPPLPTMHREVTSSQTSIDQSIYTTSNGTTITTNVPTGIPTPTVRTVTQSQFVFPTITRSRRTYPTPTVRPTRVPTPSISLTSLPQTESGITATPTKTQPTTSPIQSAAPSSNEKRDFIMQAINEYRKSLGLSSVQVSTETCGFAKIRAKEISTSFTHDGFESRIQSDTIPYHSWSSITENIAMTSNYKDVVTMWINSPGHAANMQKNTPYVCVEDYGNYYAYEGMKP
jgi:uncharacterized protein YkwD